VLPEPEGKLGLWNPEGGFVIQWNNSEKSRVALGADFDALVGIIRDHGVVGHSGGDGVELRWV